MIFLMQDAHPFGYFLGGSGQAVDLKWFARECNAEPREIRKAMAQLETEGVFDRDDQGRIFSRRLVRQYAKRLQASDAGIASAASRLSLVPDLPRRNDPGNADDPLNGIVNDPLNGSANKALNGSANKPFNPAIAHHRDPDTRTQITDSLRSSAMAFGDFPPDVETLKGLALLFLAAFGRVTDPLKAEKHVGHYTTALAQMRRNGVSIEQAWRAFSDAVNAHGKPLFFASAKLALNFLPAYSRAGADESHDRYAQVPRD